MKVRNCKALTCTLSYVLPMCIPTTTVNSIECGVTAVYVYSYIKCLKYHIHFNFRGVKLPRFYGSAAIHESFIPRKFRPVWQGVCACKMIASQKCKNGNNSLGQLHMQLRTSPEAIDYINTTKIQRKQ